MPPSQIITIKLSIVGQVQRNDNRHVSNDADAREGKKPRRSQSRIRSSFEGVICESSCSSVTLPN